MTKRTCPECKASFIPERASVVCCSKSCAAKRSNAAKIGRLSSMRCHRCGEDFSPIRRDARFCSQRCSATWRRQNESGECSHEDCPRPVRAKGMCNKHYKAMLYATGRVLPDPWSDRRRDAYHRRRAMKVASSTGDPVLRDEIAERDGFVCGICRGVVDMAVEWPDRMSATLDHVVPLSRGGAHDPLNIQLAHLTCNSAKRDRVA